MTFIMATLGRLSTMARVKSGSSIVLLVRVGVWSRTSLANIEADLVMQRLFCDPLDRPRLLYLPPVVAHRLIKITHEYL